jgi:hypothetical protein
MLSRVVAAVAVVPYCKLMCRLPSTDSYGVLLLGARVDAYKLQTNVWIQG